MAKRHPLLGLARMMCDLTAITGLLDNADDEAFTVQWVLKRHDEIDACVSKQERALREHHLYDEVVAAMAASRKFSAERRGREADLATLEVSRALLEISGQNDRWRKQFGFGHIVRTKQ